MNPAPRILAAAIIRGWWLLEGGVWFCEVLRVTSHHARGIFVVTRIRSVLYCRWSYVHNRDRDSDHDIDQCPISKCSHAPVGRLVRSILHLQCMRNSRTTWDEPAAKAWQRGLRLNSTLDTFITISLRTSCGSGGLAPLTPILDFPLSTIVSQIIGCFNVQ